MRTVTGIGLSLVVYLGVLLLPASCGGEDPYDALEKGPPLRAGSPSDIQVPVLSPDEGKKMIEFKCTKCHSTTGIKRSRLTAVEWEARILRCKEKPGGAKIAPLEAKSLSNYLANKYKD